MNTITSPLVLMYHGIASTSMPFPEGREIGAELYDVTSDNFKAQIQWLKDQGYTAKLIEELSPGQGKTVIITFDDGEMSDFIHAFPVLKKLGWKAYFFIIVKRIGQKGYMGWEELKELTQAGMVIGSHGLSHEILTNLLDSQMEEELLASKKNLENNLNIKVDKLSIPRGFCNDKIIEAAHRLGYSQPVFISEKPEFLKTPCLSRIAIKSNWSLKRFEKAVCGQTPWIEKTGDILKKILKTIFRESGYNWIRSQLIRLIK
ncbi:MAG: polysaccharide deacetylase family protein [Candidatus Omnitrophica bacterium]|nr:polysaccharide deacetylase family protein [Candidatus Omnitrophota bacterium]